MFLHFCFWPHISRTAFTCFDAERNDHDVLPHKQERCLLLQEHGLVCHVRKKTTGLKDVLTPCGLFDFRN